MRDLQGATMQMAAGKLYFVFVFLILVGIIVGIVVAVFGYVRLQSSLNWPTEKWEYESLAIVCDAKECANVALRTFGKGGTMIDAAVAALLCMGVTAPHLSGIGGGFLAIVYNRTTGLVFGVDALGNSPAATKPDDFQNWTLTKIGYKAPIIPGAVAGYKLLHDNFGKLPWAELFTEAVKLADNGFIVGHHLAEALKRNQKDLNYDAKGRTAFVNPATGELVAAGNELQLPHIAEVLRRIASDPTTLYTGPLGQEVEADFKREGGYVTLSELKEYRARFVEALRAEIGDNKVLYTAAFPGSGAILGAILERFNITLSILQGKGKTPPVVMKDTYLHKLVETIKFALAFRENLGDTPAARDGQNKLLSKIQIQFDKNFSPQHPLASYEDYGGVAAQDEDFGGAHLNIRDRQGNAISVTAGLNHEFGCKYWTSSGILLNSYMNAFSNPSGAYSKPPSSTNLMLAGKQPLTSMMPSVITNTTGGRHMLHAVFGSSGGTAGISAMAQLFACAAQFPLHSCVAANVPVRPYLGEHGYVVQVGPNTSSFDPASLLYKMGHTVEERTVFTSSATAIVTTARNSWMAPVDTEHTDGSTAGFHYEHPVIKNDRLD
ncbi:glutathione hydrolase 1 proenzyme-like isoform X3 [Rhipicephalus microplus]|uniref:glutathione hydrolase 1 proenzyme-like isoform X3 n=1 Tax=Rhipicephalus microplus TaxID=6941 RepID=UPI003F6A560C